MLAHLEPSWRYLAAPWGQDATEERQEIQKRQENRLR